MWVATLSLKNPIKVLIFFLLPHPLIVELFMLCLTLPYSQRSAPITGTLFYSLSRPPQNHMQQGLSWASSSLGVIRPSLSRCGFMWYHHRHCLPCNTSLPLSQSCDMSSLPGAGTSAHTPKRMHFSHSVIYSFQQLYSGANVFFLLICVPINRNAMRSSSGGGTKKQSSPDPAHSHHRDAWMMLIRGTSS